MESKRRDYLLDNYKGLLIVLVVVGHFVDAIPSGNSFLHYLKWLIFAFHMPAFVFISGYFSRKQISVTVLVRRLIIPYLIFEVLYYLLYTFVIHKETELYLFWPKYTLWYLLALFMWKLVTPYVKKIPGHMLIAIAAGLWVGTSNLDDNFLTLPRMIYFYPYFLWGTIFSREWLKDTRSRLSKAAKMLPLLLILVVVIGVAATGILPIQIFYGRHNYELMGLSLGAGLMVRIGCYILSALLTLWVMMVLPDRQGRFSDLGRHTMPIYLFHGLIYKCLECGREYYGLLAPWLQSFLILFISLVVVYMIYIISVRLSKVHPKASIASAKNSGK